MTTRKRLKAEQALNAMVKNIPRYWGVLGTPAGVVEVPNRIGFVYVRLSGDQNQVVEALNKTTQPMVADDVVELEMFVPGRYRIAGRASVVYVSDPLYGLVSAHAAQHERADRGTGGYDPVEVYTRMLVPVRAHAQTVPNMTLKVDPGYYPFGTSFAYFAGGNSPTFSAGPLLGSRTDLLYLTSAGVLTIQAGLTLVSGVPQFPATLPAGCVPLAFVTLTATAAAITETEILDARVVLAAANATALLTPATTVTDETTYGIAKAVGVDTTYAREDHTHGSPALTANTPTASAVGDTGAVGSGTKPSKDDHKHAREAFGSPTDVGSANADGAGTTIPHSAHVHKGVHSVAKSGDAALYGDVTLSAGANVTLTESGNNIAIAAAAGSLEVKEVDGVPDVTGVVKIVVSNGTLTDDGAGQVTLVTAGAGSLEVKEVDGVPDVSAVTVVQVPNGSLTDNTGGNVTINPVSGSAPTDVGSANAAGSDTLAPKRDHVHKGVHSVAKSGAAALYGDVTLSAGTNVTLTEAGNDISIAAAAGGIEVKEADGAPDVTGVSLIIVTNGKLTDNGGGSISLDLSGGGGGASSGDIMLQSQVFG